MMRIVFMGTPDFAVASLKALAEQGADYRAILAHYYPGTELRG